MIDEYFYVFLINHISTSFIYLWLYARCDDGYQFDETYQDPNRVVCIPAVDTKCQCPGDGYYTGDCDEQGRCICVTVSYQMS